MAALPRRRRLAGDAGRQLAGAGRRSGGTGDARFRRSRWCSTATALYLRRYWRDERWWPTQCCARASGAAGRHGAAVRGWLDRLFARPALDARPTRGSTGRSWPARWRCAASCRSSPAVPAPARPTRWRACWRCCSRSDAGARSAAHRAGRAHRQGRRAPEAVDRQGAGRAGSDKLGERAAAARPDERAWARRAPCTACWARGPTRAASPTMRRNPLDVDVLIVDEASMVHLEMMAALLDALPPTRAPDPAGRQGPAGVGGGGRGAGRPVPRCAGRPLRPATSAMLAELHRRATCPHASSTARLGAGPAHGDAAQQPAFRRSHRPAGAGGESWRRPAWRRHCCRRRRDASLRSLTAPSPGFAVEAGGCRLSRLPEVHAGRPAASGDIDAWIAQVLAAFDRFRMLCARA